MRFVVKAVGEKEYPYLSAPGRGSAWAPDQKGAKKFRTLPLARKAIRVTTDAGVKMRVFRLVKRCPVHEFEEHGREAEELRRGVEKIIARHCGEEHDRRYADPEGLLDAVCDDLQTLLEEVDSRDSLAFRERRTKRDRTAKATEKEGGR